MPSVRGSRGRPRDGSIDQRALAAARELVVERGFTATTMVAVAERAGVHTSALYRRWPSTVALLEAALSPVEEIELSPPSGDLRRDLTSFVATYERAFLRPEVQAAGPGMLAHYRASPDGLATGDRSPWSVRPHFRALLAAAPAPDVDPDVDPDRVFEALLGILLVRALLHPGDPVDREHVVDLVERLVRR